MNNCKKSLPGIRRLCAVKRSLLPPGMVRQAMTGQPVPVLAGLEPVPFSGVPVCTAVTELSNNACVEKTTLEFVTTSDFSFLSEPLAFVAVDCNGEAWAIGSKEPPFPVVVQSKTTGFPSGDAAASKVTVTFTAPKSLLPAVV